jgi:anti-sigma B factor antagonist
MSSAGFRALLMGQRNCKRSNRGEIILAAVPKKVMDALELTGFTPLFRIFDDLTSAVGSF